VSDPLRLVEATTVAARGEHTDPVDDEAANEDEFEKDKDDPSKPATIARSFRSSPSVRAEGERGL